MFHVISQWIHHEDVCRCKNPHQSAADSTPQQRWVVLSAGPFVRRCPSAIWSLRSPFHAFWELLKGAYSCVPLVRRQGCMLIKGYCTLSVKQTVTGWCRTWIIKRNGIGASPGKVMTSKPHSVQYATCTCLKRLRYKNKMANFNRIMNVSYSSGCRHC